MDWPLKSILDDEETFHDGVYSVRRFEEELCEMAKRFPLQRVKVVIGETSLCQTCRFFSQFKYFRQLTDLQVCHDSGEVSERSIQLDIINISMAVNTERRRNISPLVLDCEKIEKVQVTGFNSIVTMDTVSCLLLAPNLSSLSLEMNGSLVLDQEWISDGVNMPNLLKLSLMGCVNVSVECVAILLEKTPRLTFLNLEGCGANLFTSLDIVHMNYPENLQYLNVSNSSFTDPQVLNNIECLKQLQVLDISNTKMENDSIEILLNKYCKRGRKVIMKDVSGDISLNQLSEQLKQRAPFVKLIEVQTWWKRLTVHEDFESIHGNCHLFHNLTSQPNNIAPPRFKNPPAIKQRKMVRVMNHPNNL